MPVRVVFVLFFILLSVAPLAASSILLERNWLSPVASLQGSLTVQVPQTQVGPNGQPQTVWVTDWVHVRVHLRNAAPLRVGEREFFRVDANVVGSHPGAAIHVNLRPDFAYHAYRSDFTTAFGGWADLHLFNDGRIRNRPPATFDEIQVSFETPEDPFVLSFRDFGAEVNAEADTTVAFRILRRVWFGKDRLVAAGEVKDASTVVITKDSPFAAAGEEWFKTGKGYRILLKMRRVGSEVYTADWSSELGATFSFEKEAVLHVDHPESARERNRREGFRRIGAR